MPEVGRKCWWWPNMPGGQSSFLCHEKEDGCRRVCISSYWTTPGHGFHMAGFPALYTPKPSGDLKQSWNLLPLPGEIIKPGLGASAEGEENLSCFKSSGSHPTLSGAQVPILLQCPKESLEKEQYWALSTTPILATKSRALDPSANNVQMWLGESLLSLVWVFYKVSFYEGLINWNDTLWNLQKL